MKRRDFFRGLLAGSAVAAVPVVSATPAAHIQEHPLSTLARFNQGCKGYHNGERVGDYSVFFTGLISSQESTKLHGQWLAWPGAWNDIEVRRATGRFFYASVPGTYAGEYHRGEVFRLPTGLYFDLDTELGCENARALVVDGHDRLLDHMRSVGAI